MGRVKIVTDSTADLPLELASEFEIAVVPCQILWGTKTYLDGIDMDPETFYRRLAASQDLPHTSQPMVRSFLEAYQPLLQENGTSVVSVHVAGNLSGTVNAAWTAAQTLDRPDRVRVVDSGQVSMGLGWAAVEAARMAGAGATLEEVVEGLQSVLPRVRTAAMIDTLENLYKGGRINQISALLGTALQIKPLVDLADGEITVWRRVRTRSKALVALVERIKSWGPLAEVAVLHAGAKDRGQGLLEQVQALFPDRRLEVLPAGSALTTHLGLGAVGVCALAASN